MSGFKRGSATKALLAVALASLVGIGAADGVMAMRAQALSPTRAAEAETAPDGFPEVDWDYLHSVSPDIIGWVTVPGTEIDFPVMRADPDDPGYWLSHDLDGSWSFYGKPYLDADCEGGIEGSRNAVILGHNIHGGRMFAPFAEYLDKEWAQAHREVLLQTPRAKYRLEVMAAHAIPGNRAVKVTEFENDGQFLRYLAERIEESDMVLDDGQGAERMFTFVTCSYTQWADNERTLVYARIGEEVRQ